MDDTIEVSARRYRYTGKERDEETGLYYHGARYYACWLGRWTSADPAGMVDGPNLYQYVRGRPIGLHDPSGTTNEPVNDIDKQIAQMTDAQLHRHLKGMSASEKQWEFAHTATGMFKERAAATLHNLGVKEPSSVAPPAPRNEDSRPRSLDSFVGKDFLTWDPSKSLQQTPAPTDSAPNRKKGTEVLFWDRVGMTDSSFGHVSAVIDGYSYSYGPNGGSQIQPWEEYVPRELQLGGATGLELNLTEEQKAGLAESYRQYHERPYNALVSNCGDPVESYLTNLYSLHSATVMPERLYENLRPLAIRENRYDIRENRMGFDGPSWYDAPWGTPLGQILLDPSPETNTIKRAMTPFTYRLGH